jgi:hypothetical protein
LRGHKSLAAKIKDRLAFIVLVQPNYVIALRLPVRRQT